MPEKLLLIAEKPSLMRELKTVYEKNKNQIPFYIDFLALAGHVCMYKKPDEYPLWNKKWVDLQSLLPMIPEKWETNVMKDKKDIVKGIQEKLKTGNYDGMICATDADREGNLIYHFLETKLGIKLKTYRFWVHDLTEKEILKSFLNMVDLHNDEFQKNLTYASVLRSRFDWLVGMNYTVAASLHSNSLMKIGRVKSPTLKMVYDNSKAIDEFVAKTTYGVESFYKEGFNGILLKDNSELFFEKETEASDVIKQLSSTATVESIEKKKVSSSAPQLFKLSDLQVYANKTFGFSPEQTLNIVQDLYEKKILSYPRCDCRHISTENAKNFKTILNSLRCLNDFIPYIDKISESDMESVKKNKKYTNDEEVNKNSHTALIPTGESIVFDELSENEKKILKCVAARFISIFLNPLVEEKTILISKNNSFLFKTNGKIVLDKGYTELYGKKIEDNEIPPDIKKGDILNVEKVEIREKTSTPPARLTEGQLIAEMENISKYIENKGLKEVMKDAKGIGTPSSRASIISGLIKDGYIDTKTSKKSKGLYISEKGKQYIENIIDFDILSPELTAIWEEKLKQIEQGKMSSTQFNEEMLNFMKKGIKDISSTTMSKTTHSTSKEVLGKCPLCGCDVVESVKGYGCLGYKNNPPCKFVIWKNNKLFETSKKKITAAKIKKLLKNGYFTEKNMISKTGKKYDAKFIVDVSGNGTFLKMEFDNKGGNSNGKKRND